MATEEDVVLTFVLTLEMESGLEPDDRSFIIIELLLLNFYC